VLADNETDMPNPTRITRVKYLQVVVGTFAGALALIPIGLSTDKYPALVPVWFGLTALWALLSLGFLVTFGVRRLHDFDQPGWWMALILIPYVNLALVLGLLLAPGNPNANRFGEVPVG